MWFFCGYAQVTYGKSFKGWKCLFATTKVTNDLFVVSREVGRNKAQIIFPTLLTFPLFISTQLSVRFPSYIFKTKPVTLVWGEHFRPCTSSSTVKFYHWLFFFTQVSVLRLEERMCGHLWAFRSTCRKINSAENTLERTKCYERRMYYSGSGAGDDPACPTQQLRNQNRPDSKWACVTVSDFLDGWRSQVAACSSSESGALSPGGKQIESQSGRVWSCEVSGSHQPMAVCPAARGVGTAGWLLPQISQAFGNGELPTNVVVVVVVVVGGGSWPLHKKSDAFYESFQLTSSVKSSEVNLQAEWAHCTEAAKRLLVDTS